ncbi:MAG: DUF4013 domain-containing protein [Candidatus Promineifilaceae bacterium]|nr:DUF4013 domain-containing protein [Candidatus Promineifilaceae bacterium]
MDVNKAFTFVFDDERWITKVLIGSVLLFFSFLIVPVFFFAGYMIQIVRNVMDGLENPLPEWEEWGRLFKDGLVYTIAGLIYTLPIWILMCCSLIFFIPAAGVEGDIGEILAGVGILSMIVVSCLMLLFVIALALIGPAIAIQYARESTLSATLRFSEVIGMTRDHIGDVLIVLLIILGLSFAISLPAAIPFVGWIITLAASVYVGLVTGHFYGQIGAKVGGSPKEKAFDSPVE